MDRSYRKFLKKVPTRAVPEVGQLMPNFPVGTNHLHDYLEDGLLVVVVSTRCPACEDALSALYRYFQNHLINSILLVDTPKENMPVFEEVFAEYTKVFHIEWEVWKNYFPGVPWASLLDGNGRILKAGPFRSSQTLKPILEIHNKEKVYHDA